MAIERVAKVNTLTAWSLTRTGTGLPSDFEDEFAGYDAPKMKFLFTVSFEFGDALGMNSNLESTNMASVKYACKHATRPNINVNYSEVNSYNYRYKVATRTDYGTVTVTFYDDNKNSAHNIFERYLKAISPVANKTRGPGYYGRDSLDSERNIIQSWASLGPLPRQDADGLIKTMRVSHYYNSGYRDGSEYYSVIHYDYINPKIQQFNWDELDMSQSDVSMISATFVYDSVNINVEHRQGALPTT